MNKLIIQLLICGVVAACHTPQTYTINGKIANHGGRILLLSLQTDGGWDTLGNVVTADGSFTFSGECPQPLVAEIIPTETRCRIPLFLEEGEYKIEVDAKKPQEYVVSGGGELQRQRNLFRQEEFRIRAVKDSMRTEYEKLYDINTNFGRLQIRTLLAQLDTLTDQAIERFICQYDNVVSASLLYYRQKQLFEQKCLHKKYDLLGENAKQSIFGQQILPLVEKERCIVVGGTAPNFTMETPDGKTLSLYDIKAKVKIIDFWASWCGPCRAANPHLREVYQKFKSKGLEIIGVSLDSDREAWKKAIQEDQLEWVQLSDLKGWKSVAADLFDIHAIPCIYILDENNRIIGARVWGEEVDQHVEKIFGK